ncbi:MAG: hypothetical protein ABIE36_01825 [Candidatus Diapherotrites archaeon]
MDNNKKTRKELISLLDELNIVDFTINTEEKQLSIHYKEDFDIFFPKLNAKPEVLRDRDKILPYGATHFASFDYNTWHIKGNILQHKPNLSANSKYIENIKENIGPGQASPL